MDKNYYLQKLSQMMDIDYVNEILNLIDAKYINVRKSTYSNEYYLYYIMLVLKELQKWSSLMILFDDEKKYHYKSISRIHLKWSKLNIYEEAYKILLEKYKKVSIKGSAYLISFIDSTDIYNKNGCEKIGYGQDPKKKKTRVSAICDTNKNILSLIVTDRHLKEVEFNGRKYLKPTLQNDTKSVIPTIDKLLIDQLKCKQFKLVGDKGYATSEENKIILDAIKNTDIIYPHRRNQKNKTPIEHKKILKKRYIIENVFAGLKHFDRICMRKDRLETTFIGFLFLATICMFKK
jgi:hypothetical protein